MLPAAGLEFPGSGALRDRNTFAGIRYFADTFDLDAIDTTRQPRNVFWFYREEQLEIFTTVQRELQRIERATATQFRHIIVDRQ